MGAERFQEAFYAKGVIDNTDIFRLVTGMFFEEACGTDGGVDTDDVGTDTSDTGGTLDDTGMFLDGGDASL